MCWPFFYDKKSMEEGGSQIFFCFSLLKEYGIKKQNKILLYIFIVASCHHHMFLFVFLMLYNKLSFNPPFTPQLFSL